MRNLFALLILFHFGVLLEAQPACVPNNCCCGAPEEVGIPNGNFEDVPIAPLDGRISFFAGENYSTWQINSGSIDLLGPNYSNFTQGNPNGASQFIDLNGFEPGTISTTLSGMTTGAMYTIMLWYAINPGGSEASCNIQVANGAWLNDSWSATNPGGVEWLERCFTFTAQGHTAELKFVGSSNFITAGMLLDDITMWTCPPDKELLENRLENVYVPNAFSPNDDGFNDVFLIFAKPGIVQQVKFFYIFDRWGDAMFAREDFQPNDPKLGWDGWFRGQPMNPGVYVWWAELEFVDGVVEVIKGDVLLVQ